MWSKFRYKFSTVCLRSNNREPGGDIPEILRSSGEARDKVLVNKRAAGGVECP